MRDDGHEGYRELMLSNRDEADPISATADLYEQLGIADEAVSPLRELDDGDLELDVTFRVRTYELQVEATIRVSRSPHKSTIAELNVTAGNLWRDAINGQVAEMLPRPTIRAARVALQQAADAAIREARGWDPEEPVEIDSYDEVTADALAALATPGAIAVRSGSDEQYLDLAARTADLMSRDDDYFPPRAGPSADRPLGAVGRLWVEEERRLNARNEERRRAGKKPRPVTASDERSFRRRTRLELNEAIRRGFLEHDEATLTPRAVSALQAGAPTPDRPSAT